MQIKRGQGEGTIKRSDELNFKKKKKEKTATLLIVFL